MNQQFEEDRAELDAHLAERVRAYIELGETPEQAEVSAREKFGEVKTVVHALYWQRARRSPVAIGTLAGACWLALYLPLSILLHTALWQLSQIGWSGPPLSESIMIAPPLSAVIVVQTILATVPAMICARLLGRRFPHRSRAIVLGMMAFSLLAWPTHEPLVGVLAGIGGVCGSWASRCKPHRRKRA